MLKELPGKSVRSGKIICTPLLVRFTVAVMPNVGVYLSSTVPSTCDAMRWS